MEIGSPGNIKPLGFNVSWVLCDLRALSILRVLVILGVLGVIRSNNKSWGVLTIQLVLRHQGSWRVPGCPSVSKGGGKAA